MPTAEPVLLDTHVVLWWTGDRSRLSDAAVDAIAAAPTVLVSPITCWEIAMLVAKRRVALDRPVATWTVDLFRSPRVEVADLSAPIAVAAADLGDFHGDPADRFLVATARGLRVPLVTKDRLIHDHARDGDLRLVW